MKLGRRFYNQMVSANIFIYKLFALDCSAPKQQDPGFVEKLITQIIRNVQVSCQCTVFCGANFMMYLCIVYVGHCQKHSHQI